jgi:hypothetical protein
VALSNGTLKNLLDVMQKVSLAVAGVSIWLLSTFVLSRDRVEALAQPELDRLLDIRNNHGRDTANTIVGQALEHVDPKRQTASGRRRCSLEFRIILLYPLLLAFSYLGCRMPTISPLLAKQI